MNIIMSTHLNRTHLNRTHLNRTHQFCLVIFFLSFLTFSCERPPIPGESADEQLATVTFPDHDLSIQFEYREGDTLDKYVGDHPVHGWGSVELTTSSDGNIRYMHNWRALNETDQYLANTVSWSRYSNGLPVTVDVRPGFGRDGFVYEDSWRFYGNGDEMFQDSIEIHENWDFFRRYYPEWDEANAELTVGAKIRIWDPMAFKWVYVGDTSFVYQFDQVQNPWQGIMLPRNVIDLIRLQADNNLLTVTEVWPDSSFVIWESTYEYDSQDRPIRREHRFPNAGLIEEWSYRR